MKTHAEHENSSYKLLFKLYPRGVQNILLNPFN